MATSTVAANTASYGLEGASTETLTAAQAQAQLAAMDPAAVGVEAFAATTFIGVSPGSCTSIRS